LPGAPRRLPRHRHGRLALGANTRIGIVRPYILIFDYVSDTDTLTLLRIVHGKRNITRRLIKR
jgi:plasmid stabilization system protein ParE